MVTMSQRARRDCVRLVQPTAQRSTYKGKVANLQLIFSQSVDLQFLSALLLHFHVFLAKFLLIT